MREINGALSKPAVLACFFLGLGAFDGMFGVIWPSLAASLERDLGDLGYLLAAYLVSSMAGSLSAARVMQLTGIRRGIQLSGVGVIVGSLAVLLAHSWVALLVAVCVRGLANGMAHAYLNTYCAAGLTSRQTIMTHAAWGTGATVCSATMTALLTASLPWQWGLLWTALPVAITVAVVLALPHQANPERSESRVPPTRLNWIAVLATGTYVAVEAGVGQWAFTLMSEGWGLTVPVAGGIASAFWALLTLGRLVLGSLPVHAGQWLAVMPWVIGVGACGLFAGFWNPWLGALSILCVALGSSVIFPSLIFQGLNHALPGVKPKLAGYMLTAAAAGGASGPAAMGALVSAGVIGAVAAPLVLASGVLIWSARQMAGSPQALPSRTPLKSSP